LLRRDSHFVIFQSVRRKSQVFGQLILKVKVRKLILQSLKRLNIVTD